MPNLHLAARRIFSVRGVVAQDLEHQKELPGEHLESLCCLALVYHFGSKVGTWSQIRRLAGSGSSRPAGRAANAAYRSRRHRGAHLERDRWGSASDWLDPAAQQVLVRAVAQAGVCESLEAKLRELRRQPNPDLEAIGGLAAQHAASAKALVHLLGVLRATPRARMVPRGASRQLAQVPRVRPWEEASDG